MQLHVDDHIRTHFSPAKPLFDQLMALQGERFREQKGRLTQRVLLGDKYYFIKQHRGVGWKEIIKNLLQGRLPVLGAKAEWLALQRLQRLGVNVPRVVAFGQRGINPARLESFVLMEELAPVVSLETLKVDSPILKRRLITEVARIARLMHEDGINHRDFYICHFLLAQDLQLYLIDLHRAQHWSALPERWIVKDLAGLYFSSKTSGLTQRDLYRFMQIYRGKPWRDVVKQEEIFWLKIKKRGEQLYRDHTSV